jgi:hypothetical protein
LTIVEEGDSFEQGKKKKPPDSRAKGRSHKVGKKETHEETKGNEETDKNTFWGTQCFHHTLMEGTMKVICCCTLY